MLMASSLSNGERFVILLFVARIFHSASSHLLYECIALAILACEALFVEIFADTSDDLGQFKIRQGASSGILLGAVTLPAFLLSKLVQLSRVLLSGEVQDISACEKDFEYEKMLYWTALFCCFSVVAFIFIAMHCSRNICYSLPSCSWILRFGFISALSVMYISQGWPSVLKLLWMPSHAIAEVKLVQHIFHTFPSCASIGETLLVATGLIICAGDMLRSALINGGWMPADVLVGSVKGSPISVIVQAALLGLLLFPLLLKCLLKVRMCFRRSRCNSADEENEVGRSILFFCFLAFYLVIIIPTLMQFAQNFEVHPLLWSLRFIFVEPHKTLLLSIYWVAVIYVSVKKFYQISRRSTTERILLRKYYHLMAVLMFVPALILQPEFLSLAFGAALAVFIILEIIRVWRIWPLGDRVNQFMNAFTDHRDSDMLIISHFSLLLGCALPVWMSSGFNDRPLAPFAGILSLGIGDTVASMFGHKYGMLRWSKSGKKTVEGTAAGIACMLLACWILLTLLASAGHHEIVQKWSSLFFAVSISGLLEAYTTQLDNAFIPLVFYSLLCL